MGRRQRIYSDTGMYFVTARTFQGRMLVTPSDQVNEVIGGVLAKAVALSGVELHTFVVVSNHMHLLVTAPAAKLSGFMQYLLANTSRKVGKLVNWSGSLWQRRFSAAPVLDDAAADDRLQYILSHGVKEGLVRHPEDWPGLSCLPLLREGYSAVYRFFHWARRWKKGVLCPGAEDLWSDAWAEEVHLQLTPIPSWKGLSPDAVKARVAGLLDDIVSAARKLHGAVVGAAAVLKQNPHLRPTAQKKSPQPLCHAADASIRANYLASAREWTSAFIQASKRFCAGELTVSFPPWAFRPSVLVREAGPVSLV